MEGEKTRKRLSISLFRDWDVILSAINLAKNILASATSSSPDKIKEADAIRYIFRKFNEIIHEQNQK